MGDALSVLKNLLKSLGAQYVTQSGGWEQTSGILSVGNLDDSRGWIKNSIVDHGVNGNGHWVWETGQKRGHFKIHICLLDLQVDKLPLVSISCGGTSKVIVRRSTLTILSTQGSMKNRPGPRAPPLRLRPSRNMTARSYSFTIFRRQS